MSELELYPDEMNRITLVWAEIQNEFIGRSDDLRTLSISRRERKTSSVKSASSSKLISLTRNSATMATSTLLQ